MTGSVRFPVKILVNELQRQRVSPDKADLHIQKCVDENYFITAEGARRANMTQEEFEQKVKDA